MKFASLSAATAVLAASFLQAEASIKLIQRVGTWTCDQAEDGGCSVGDASDFAQTEGALLGYSLKAQNAQSEVILGIAAVANEPAFGDAYANYRTDLGVVIPPQGDLDFTDAVSFGQLTGGSNCTNAKYSTDAGESDNPLGTFDAIARYVPGRYSGICGQCYQTYGTVCASGSGDTSLPDMCEVMAGADPSIMLPSTDTLFAYECSSDSYIEYLQPSAGTVTTHLSCSSPPEEDSPATYKVVRPVDTCFYDYLRNFQVFGANSTELVADAVASCGPTVAPALSGSLGALIGAYSAAAPTTGPTFTALRTALEDASPSGTPMQVNFCLAQHSGIQDAMNTAPRVQEYTFVTKEQGEVAAIQTFVDTDCEMSSSTSVWNTEDCNASGATSSFKVYCDYTADGEWVGKIDYYSGPICGGSILATINSVDRSCETNPLTVGPTAQPTEQWRKRLQVHCDLDASWEAPTAAPDETTSAASVTAVSSVVALASAAIVSFVYSMF